MSLVLLYITHVYVFWLVLSTEYHLCVVVLSCTELFTVHTVTKQWYSTLQL